MKFKDNQLIWEAYYNTPNIPNPGDDVYQSDDFTSEDDESSIILDLEPDGPVEPEIELGDGLDDIDDDDTDNEIILKSLRKLIKRAEILQNHCQSEKLDTWMIANIIKAEDYISDVWEEIDDVADFANDGFEDSDNISL